MDGIATHVDFATAAVNKVILGFAKIEFFSCPLLPSDSPGHAVPSLHATSVYTDGF